MSFKRLLVIIIILMFANTVYASEQPNFSGRFWGKMSASQRNIYVMGVFEGINYGNWEVWLDLAQEAKDNPPKAVTNEVMEKWSTEFAAKSLNKKRADNVTAAQVVSGITQMYMDYRNQQIPVVSIVDVVIQSIKGSSKEEIESRLIEMRKEVTSENAE